MPSDAVKSSYRVKLADIRAADSVDVQTLLQVLRGGTNPAHYSQALREHAPKVMRAKVERFKEALPALIQAHLDNGEFDVVEIAEWMKSFVEEHLRSVAGGIYVSGPGWGGGPENLHVKAQVEAEFTALKSTLVRTIPDRVAIVLGPLTAKSSKKADTMFHTKTKNILFMDVSGWSGLSPHQIHDYVTKAMPKLQEILKAAEFVNTWGDAIVATFDSAKDAAEAALHIRDFFKKSYAHDGVAKDLSCRVSLHTGEVIIGNNALTGKDDIFGHAVHLTARLEPATTPGHVFCTHSFAGRLDEVSGAAPKAWPLGPLSLPKGFGTVDASVVTWPNDSDPRPDVSVEPATANKVEPSRDMPDDDVRVVLRGWMNRLGVGESGTAFKFAELEAQLGLPTGSAKRLLSEVVARHGDSWRVQEESTTRIILKFEYTGAIVVSDPPRGWGDY